MRCCLRCCLLHHLRAHGLDGNWRANAPLLEKAGDRLRADEMLLGFGIESTMAFAALRKPLSATGGAEAKAAADLWSVPRFAPGFGRRGRYITVPRRASGEDALFLDGRRDETL